MSSADTANPAADAPPAIPAAEYAGRRTAVLEALDGAVGMLFAGPAGHEDHAWRPHPHFEYLTGVVDEPGAVLVLDPAHPAPARRATLLLSPLDPEREQWDGLRAPIAEALRTRYGIGAILRLGMLGRTLKEAVGRSRRLACMHPLAHFDQPVSPDLALFHALRERMPGVEIGDRTDLLPSMRSRKSEAEIAMIRHAASITAEGYAAMLAMVRPGIDEFAVQEALEHGYRRRGSRGPAYGSIVGSGINSTVLHYRANDRQLEYGDVICVDSGCRWGGYGADVTRTIPAGGRFTDRQREIHDIVLAALDAGIAAARPGATLREIDAAARAVIVEAGHGDAFIHSIGHHLGLETHDTCGDGPLEEGAVITVEPGIYLPAERIGVRIEDDIVIRADGAENLTRGIPRSAREIEAAMAAARG